MSFVNRRSLAGFCAAGAIALVAGCGGGDDGSDALSADEFRSQADALCQTSKDATDALTVPTSQSSNEEVGAYLTAGLKATDTMLTGLRALEPPSDLAGTLDESLDLLEERQDTIREVVGRVAAGEDAETVYDDVNAQINSLNDQADAKARELGLTVCGADDDDPGATGTTSTGTTATAPATTAGAPASAVAADVQAVQTALIGVRQSLQSAAGTSLEDLQAVVPQTRAALGEFDDAVARLASDTGATAEQEKVRAAVAAAGPKVSDVLGRLLDTFEEGDEAAATALLSELQTVYGELQTALAG